MQPGKRKFNVSLVLIGLIIVVVGVGVITVLVRNGVPQRLQANQVSPSTATVGGATSTSVSATTPTPAHLEDDASQWGIFYDGGNALAKLEQVSQPSVDGSALKISLISGQPYTGIHAYRNLPANETATTFDLTIFFYFSSATPMQALEFTMSTWVNDQRWEWALQWEHIGDGTPQQGNPPTWRLWTGSSWQNIGVSQQLSAETWHMFHLKGDLLHGQVHYMDFTCDDTSAHLDQTFAPVSAPGNKLAVAVQLDGDSQEDPYQVYLDGVNFLWS